MMRLIEALARDWNRLDKRIEALTSEIESMAQSNLHCRRTMSVPMSARSSRVQWSLQLIPGRPSPSAATSPPGSASFPVKCRRRCTILGSISKRGNKYLRKLFVQAAWVVLIKPVSWERHGLKTWIEAAKKRLHHNVLAVGWPISSSASPGLMQDRKPNRLKPLATHLPDHLSGSRPAIATTVANWNLNPTTDITRLQGVNRGILLPEFSSTA